MGPHSTHGALVDSGSGSVVQFIGQSVTATATRGSTAATRQISAFSADILVAADTIHNCTTTNTCANAIPELGSGEILATGLLPLGLALVLRRRRTRRIAQQ